MKAAKALQLLELTQGDPEICEKVGREILSFFRDELYGALKEDPANWEEEYGNVAFDSTAADIYQVVDEIVIRNIGQWAAKAHEAYIKSLEY